MRLLAAALALVATAVVAAPALAPAARTLLVISIDGLHPDSVVEADRLGFKVPNLRRFVKEGAFARAVTGVVPTVTYASHTTLVTGVSPARHGILYNNPFDPLGQNQEGWYWYAEDLRVPTLWDAAADAGLDVASLDWPVTVGARIKWNIVQFWRTDVPDAVDDRKLSRLLSTPGLLAEAEKVLGPYPSGYAYDVAADRRRTAFGVWLLETRRPRLQLMYFSGLDEETHLTWPGHPQAMAALEEIDGLVGQVRAAAERVYAGKATIAIVSDHGHTRTTRELRLNEALRAAGLIFLDERGKITGWKAKAWGSGGSSAIMLQDPADERTRQAVKAVLDGLAALPDTPILRVLDRDGARAAGGFPEATYVVGVKADARITTRMEGPVLGPGLPEGEHGHLPEVHEVDASFFLVGPGVPAGRDLGRVDMRDIAPTLATQLGLRLPLAEGRRLLDSPGVASGTE